MKQLLYCRRTFIALTALVGLFSLGLINGIDTSMAMATVAVGLAGSNAAERIGTARKTVQYGKES